MIATQTKSWRAVSTGNHQGLIIDSAGNNIAVAYDKADAPLLAAAPELLTQLEALAVQLEAFGLVVPPNVRTIIAEAKAQP